MTSETPEEVVDFYSRRSERIRLQQGRPRLELLRVREILAKHLPPAPSVVVDVGGGAGVHATWLARRGYAVHLVDPVPLHVEQAREASAEQPDAPLASASLADARALAFDDESADAVPAMVTLPAAAELAGLVTEERPQEPEIHIGQVKPAIRLSEEPQIHFAEPKPEVDLPEEPEIHFAEPAEEDEE